MITKSNEGSTPDDAGETPAELLPVSPPVIAMTDNADGPTQPAIPAVLPILPIRGVVVFPGTVVPLTLGRASALKLVDDNLPQSKIIGLATQRNEEHETPTPDDLYPIGVACQVLKLMRQPDNTIVLLVQAQQRFRLGNAVQTEPYIRAEVTPLASIMPDCRG